MLISALRDVAWDLNSYARLGDVLLTSDALNIIMEHLRLRCVREDDLAALRTTLEASVVGKALRAPEDHQFAALELTLPIPPPEMHSIYEVDMELPDKHHFAVGSSINVKVNIAASHHWAPKKHAADLQLAYEVNADLDSWAITGKKRQVFSMSESSVSSEIILVPLRPGRLSLPKVDIIPQSPLAPKDDIKVEVSHANAFETVLVVSNVNKQTISF